MIRLLLNRPTELGTTSDYQHCEVVGNGSGWRFPMFYKPVLQVLITRRLCSITDILNAAPKDLDRDAIRNIVTDLMFRGLLAICD